MQVLEARVTSKEQGLQATQLRCKHMQKELESLINVRVENARRREELSISKSETLAALRHSRIMSQAERSVKSLAQERLDERASDSLQEVTRARSEQQKAEARSFFSEKMLTKARDQIRKLELQIASAVVKDAGYVKPTNQDAAAVAGGLHSLVEVYKGKWLSSEREIEGYKVRIRRMEIAAGLLRTELEGLRVERIELVAAANAAAVSAAEAAPPREPSLVPGLELRAALSASSAAASSAASSAAWAASRVIAVLRTASAAASASRASSLPAAARR